MLTDEVLVDAGEKPRLPRFAPALTSSRARATSCSAPRKRALFSVAPGNRRLCLASAYARASPRQAHARGARGHFAPVCDRIRYSASGDPGAQHAFRRAAPLERQAKRCMTACCASFASLSVRRRWSCRLSRACLLRAAVRCDRRAPNFLRCRLSRRWASIRRWLKRAMVQEPDTPVVTRVRHDQVLFDVRTLLRDTDLDLCASALADAVRAGLRR